MQNPFHHISKSIITQVILVIWIVFSVAYIANNVWQNFKMGELEEAAQVGYQKAVSDLIQQAETCEAIPIYSGESQIELIKVGCEK